MFVIFVGAVGCGGDEVTPEPDATSETDGSTDSRLEGEGTTDDLIVAATAQFDAFLSRDDDAYFESLSRECRDRLGFGAVVGHLDGRRFTAELDGVDLAELSVDDVMVEGGGNAATVSLVIDGPSGDQFRETLPHQWLYEDDGWRMDDCADFSESQGGLEGQGMDRSQPLPLGGVADVNGWLVSLGFIDADGEDVIVETGGTPASEGNQLFTAQVGISYNGAETSIVVGDELAFAMVNGDTVYGPESDCATTGDNLYMDPGTEVGPGETAGNPIICREVSSDHATGLLLQVTHLPSGDVWWFALEG
jgi:hypothetical protein